MSLMSLPPMTGPRGNYPNNSPVPDFTKPMPMPGPAGSITLPDGSVITIDGRHFPGPAEANQGPYDAHMPSADSVKSQNQIDDILTTVGGYIKTGFVDLLFVLIAVVLIYVLVSGSTDLPIPRQVIST